MAGSPWGQDIQGSCLRLSSLAVSAGVQGEEGVGGGGGGKRRERQVCCCLRCCVVSVFRGRL